MGCNPMVVAASFFANRPSAAFINMTRPIPISLRTIFIWARSAWSVRAPALRPLLCGQPSNCSRSSKTVSLLTACVAVARRRRLCTRKSVPMTAGFLPSHPNSTSWCGRCGADTVTASSRLAQQVFAAAARENLHLALAQLPSRFFAPGSWADQTAVATITCLRSVLMKPEHLHWLEAIWSKLSHVTDEVLATPHAMPAPRLTLMLRMLTP